MAAWCSRGRRDLSSERDSIFAPRPQLLSDGADGATRPRHADQAAQSQQASIGAPGDSLNFSLTEQTAKARLRRKKGSGYSSGSLSHAGIHGPHGRRETSLLRSPSARDQPAADPDLVPEKGPRKEALQSESFLRVRFLRKGPLPLRGISLEVAEEAPKTCLEEMGIPRSGP